MIAPPRVIVPSRRTYYTVAQVRMLFQLGLTGSHHAAGYVLASHLPCYPVVHDLPFIADMTCTFYDQIDSRTSQCRTPKPKRMDKSIRAARILHLATLPPPYSTDSSAFFFSLSTLAQLNLANEQPCRLRLPHSAKSWNLEIRRAVQTIDELVKTFP